jgi:hypothetical protein
MPIVTVALIICVLSVVPLRAGDASEHRRIGDAAFVTATDADSSLRSLLAAHGVMEIVGIADGQGAGDVVITYGMISAILADPDLDPLTVLASLQTTAFRWNGDRLIVDPWLLERFRTFDALPVPLAMNEPRYHRVDPAASYERQLHVIDDLLARTFVPTVRDRDDNSRPIGEHADTLRWDLPRRVPGDLTAPALYALLHARARALALHALGLRRVSDRRRFILLAVITSAVADHALQDLFASDHHIADCVPPSGIEVIGRDSVLSAEQAACYDFYRRVGIPFRFAHPPRGSDLHGNGAFSDEQVMRATTATAISLRDVFGASTPYFDHVDAFYGVVASRPDFADSYGHALAHAPLPLVGEEFDGARMLRRSIVGPYAQVGATALTVGRSVGYSVDVGVGLVIDLTSFDLPRSRSAGYETTIALVPSVSAAYGFARERWFALARGGAAVQLFDAVRGGLSAGASFNADGVTVPVFLDVSFISKPMSYVVGLEFLLSVALTDAAPYDVRLGVAWSLY